MSPSVVRWSVAACAAVMAIGFAVSALMAPVQTQAASPAAEEADLAAPAPASEAPITPPEAVAFAGELTQGGFLRGKVPSSALNATLGDQTLTLGQDGRFFAAFDRDSPAALELSVTLADGEVRREALTISPREWQISRVNLARRSGGLSRRARKRPARPGGSRTLSGR